MADAAMTVLLETLSHILVSCSDLISGAEDELRLLGNEVESFQASLRNAANNPKKLFRGLEREIEEVVYDAQDTIDSYLIEPAAAQSKIDIFPHRRDQVLVRELASKLAKDARSFREGEVKPLLDRSRIDFPNMLLEEPVDPPLSHFSNSATVLLENISNLSMILGGDLISGAGEELRLLKNEVELLRVFLRNADSVPNVEEPLREMDWEIRQVVEDAQVIIDFYLSQASVEKSKTDFFRQRRDAPVSSLAEVVRSLREDKVKPMFENARVDFAEMLRIGEGSQTTLEEEEEPHQIKVNKVWSIGEERSVGVEDEQATITDYLKQETEKLDYISIIGMPGMGKTTLARRVYQSQQIRNEFPTRIWVTVSEDLNKKDVFLNILKEVSSKDMSSMSSDELALAVHHFLEKRKFLLVLDDVWTHLDFYEIQIALPKSNGKSKVLITSRVQEVGNHANPSRGPHNLRFLSDAECWRLLQMEVFGGLHICPAELIEIGEDIARKCDGLALTVVLIGGILASQLSEEKTISALKKAWIVVFEYMSNNRLPHQEKWEFIFRAIEYSYITLPDELRNLFLYLGVFPEDYEIPTTTLICLWIAEGFIQHQDGRSLEDVAEENLNHLIERKLVIVDKVKSNGKAKSCHLHDTVRDFCTRKGMQVRLFREIRDSYSLKTFPIQKKHRRLCIHFDPVEFFSSKPYIPNVRSFSCFYKTEKLLLPENTSKIPGDAFELLRVLDIKPIRFTRFPLELTQLFCLRYVVLSSDFKILPEFISMLRNIQTLTIHTTSRTLEIKADIWKMIQLRHLQTNASIMLRKEPEDDLNQELQTLTNLSPDNCTNNVFNQARCLKKLGIRGTLSILLDGEVGSRKIDHLEKLKKLENLKLLNDVHMVSPSEGRMPCLPPPDKFPPKLRSLTLSATLLSWEHMSVLGKLEKLEVLKLKDNAFVGECWEVEDHNFPSLQVLQIGYTNLVSWKATSRHFPKLRSLALRNCEKLEALPQGLESAHSLQEIELLRPSKPVVVSARKIEKDRLQMEGNLRIKLSIYFPPDE